MSTITVTFTPTAKPISDYVVEEIYQQTLKGTKEVDICNDILLTRFSVGLVEGDFKKLVVKTTDNEGNEFEEVSTDGTFCKLWNIKIFGLHLDLSLRII